MEEMLRSLRNTSRPASASVFAISRIGSDAARSSRNGEQVSICADVEGPLGQGHAESEGSVRTRWGRPDQGENVQGQGRTGGHQRLRPTAKRDFPRVVTRPTCSVAPIHYLVLVTHAHSSLTPPASSSRRVSPAAIQSFPSCDRIEWQ